MFVLPILIGIACQEPPPNLPDSTLDHISWLNQSKQIKYPSKEGVWTGWLLLPLDGQPKKHSILIFKEHPSHSDWKDCVDKYNAPDTMFISVTPNSKSLGVQYLEQQPTSNIQYFNCS